MIRELIVLRHAKSDWNTKAARDFDRPLAKRGVKAAKKMGHWMQRQEIMPDYIITSPAKRAQQTLRRLGKVLEFDDKLIHTDKRIYEANVETLLNVLADCPSEPQRVMLVGHNPGLEMLLLYLCPEASQLDVAKLMPTAALARVEMPADWSNLSANSGHLLHIQRPRQLDT